MKQFNFTAIDFETMTPEMTSACALGIVRVENGVIVQKFYSLIKPVPDNRPTNNSFVHGITPEMVENAPTFKDLWPDIRKYFEHQIIVAHNAAFDMTVLEKTTDAYDIQFPIEDIIDTMQITNMSLSDSCALSDIPLDAHHDALCDATACAKLMMLAMGIRNFELNRKKDKPTAEFNKKHVSSDTVKPLEDEEVENKETPFFQKKVVLTGNLLSYPKREEIACILKRYGADINTSISKLTNIVIVGSGAGPSKMQKIDQLKRDGYAIRVIFEDELIEIMEKFNIK